VIKPKLIKKEMMVLDENQVQSFLLPAGESRYQMIYFLAIGPDLREGELLGLCWSDIDWVNRRIQIKRQLQRLPQGKDLAFSEPKSRADRRVIIVGPMVLEKLRDYMNQQQLVCQFAGDRWQENDLVFPSSIGTPMEWQNMVRDFKKPAPAIRFAQHPLPRPAAYSGNFNAEAGYPSQGGPGASWAFPDQPDARYLFPCIAIAAGRSRRETGPASDANFYIGWAEQRNDI
jgi:hypothetical protein